LMKRVVQDYIWIDDHADPYRKKTSLYLLLAD
jgi:hypothetical protein